VTPGRLYLLLGDYWGKVAAGSQASLVMSWQDAKGGWLDQTRRASEVAAGDYRGWATTATAGRAPRGAAVAVVMLFADNQPDLDEVAFDNVRMFAVE
jgi:hypothetical protein